MRVAISCKGRPSHQSVRMASTWDFHHLRGSQGKANTLGLDRKTLDLSWTSKYRPDDRCVIDAHNVMRVRGSGHKTFEALAPRLQDGQHSTLSQIYMGRRPAGATPARNSPREPFALKEVWAHQFQNFGQLPSVRSADDVEPTVPPQRMH